MRCDRQVSALEDLCPELVVHVDGEQHGVGDDGGDDEQLEHLVCAHVGRQLPRRVPRREHQQRALRVEPVDELLPQVPVHHDECLRALLCSSH